VTAQGLNHSTVPLQQADLADGVGKYARESGASNFSSREPERGTLDLVLTYWVWIISALIASGPAGYWSTRPQLAHGGLPGWQGWAALVFAIGLVVAILLPGQAGLYLDALLFLSFLCITGFLAGAWVRRARTQVATARAAEDARNAAEVRIAEEAARAAEAKAAEEARRASELKAADEACRSAEAKAAEEARHVAEVKAADEARWAAEAKAAEEARRVAEVKVADEARRAAEANVADEARRVAEGGPSMRRATPQKSRPRRRHAAPQKVKAAEDTPRVAEVKAAGEGTKRRRNPARKKAEGNDCATVGQGQ
jgi:hypothetical protein